MSEREFPFREAEAVLGHSFGNRDLLLTAFTHTTYANRFGGESNERLEFLGDAVLELLVTERLLRTCGEDEGTLTDLRKDYVSQTALEEAEKRAGLMRFLRFEGSEENIGGKTPSNLFEAAVGAVYLDGGLTAAGSFAWSYLSIVKTENYKTLLQELVQKRSKTAPRYQTVEEDGRFVCTVSAMGAEASGEGSGKKAAETAAASVLYQKLSKGNHS